MPKELRDLRITKIALVRKGYRPVNDGARITVVKAEEVPTLDPKSPNLAERLAKAIAGVLGSESMPESVEKAKTATHIVADNGDHGMMSGIHSHDHSHRGDDGQIFTHSHEHAHDGDSNHYHTYDPGHVSKAHVHKAEDDADAKADERVTKLIERLDKIVEDLKAAQEKDVALEKAIPSEDALAKLVDERVNAALEPIAKAIEDLGVERARAPKTPNPTGPISPTAKVDPTADKKAVEGMTFGEALRYLTNKN